MLGLDPALLALAATVAFLAAIVGGLSGFGVGLVLPPFLAALVGVAGVVPTMAVAALIINLSRFSAYRRAVDWRVVRVLIVAVLPAVAAGAWVYTLLPERAIALVLGSFLIAAIPLRRVLGRRPASPAPRTLFAFGVAFGGLSGMTTGGSVVLIAGLMAIGLEGAALVGTDAAISTVANLVRVAVYGVNDGVTAQRLVAGILVGLATVPAAFVARALMDRIPLRAHTRIMEALVAAGGASFLWRAVA
jgi:uncharacterized membrane protein YfcA